MKFTIPLLLLSLVMPCSANEKVPLASLGALDIEFSKVLSVETVPGPPLRGEMRARAGEAFSVALPMTASRAAFTLSPGDQVAAGDPVVWLEGPDVEHWLSEYRALTAQLEIARQRYQRNQRLYQDNVLAAEQWADIQARYFALQLQHEHMQHFYDLLPSDGISHQGVMLASPRAGSVVFDSRLDSISIGETAFSVVAPGTLRLHVEVPSQRSAELAGLSLPGCRLAVDRIDGVARNFFVSAWSEPTREGCPQRLGTLVSAIPLYYAAALVIPRDALFQWQGEPHVLVRSGDLLHAHRVVLIADTPQGYAIGSDEALADQDVLSRSVSAVQGILLGLGGE